MITLSVIRGNSAEEGGGIQVGSDSDCYIDSSIMSNNNASSGGGIRAYGNGTLTLLNCRLQQNRATVWGGGIDAAGARTTVITESIIRGNSAVDGGGGIHLGPNADCRITTSTIETNVAEDGGGVHSNSPTRLDIAGTDFQSNTAERSGGGLFLYSEGTTSITDCLFSSNSAILHGGGIEAFDAGEVTIADCTFSANHCAEGGEEGVGGGAALHGTIHGSIQASSFESNTAKNGGGAWCGDETEVDILNCDFLFNAAGNSDMGGFGGGVGFWGGASGQIVNCVIENNRSTEEGGGIHIMRAAVDIIDCNICDNTCLATTPALGWGGGINLYDVRSLITGNHICGNSATRDAGGIMAQGDPAGRGFSAPILVNNLIENNIAGRAGGGIASALYDSIAIRSNTIRNNLAGLKGGGVSIDGDCYAELENNQIGGNQAGEPVGANPVGGGGVFVSNSIVHAENNWITRNSVIGTGAEAEPWGGAIRVTGAASRVRLRENQIRGNRAGSAGAIRVDTNARAWIIHNLMEMNSADLEGAAMIIQGECSGRIENNTIVESRLTESTKHGAAVTLVDSNGVTFSRNIIANSSNAGGIRTTMAENGSIVERNLYWNNSEGPYRQYAELSWDLLLDPTFTPDDSLYRPLPGSVAFSTGGLNEQGTPLDMGWLEETRPLNPMVKIDLVESPDTVVVGNEVAGTYRLRNLTGDTLEVTPDLRVVGRYDTVLATPQVIQLPPHTSFYLPMLVSVPLVELGDEGRVILARAWLGDELQSSDTHDLWIAAAP